MSRAISPTPFRLWFVRPAIAAVLVLIATVACAPEAGSTSRAEYLDLVAEWRDRDTDIRDRAARAADDETNEAFPGLFAESEALRADMTVVDPPDDCTALHEALVSAQDHFGKALDALGKGDDLKAVDELVRANEARGRMKAELERFGTES